VWRDMPVLISVGYEACDWCYVLERQSTLDRTRSLEFRIVPGRRQRQRLE
jgi:hypothetical protein